MFGQISVRPYFCSAKFLLGQISVRPSFCSAWRYVRHSDVWIGLECSAYAFSGAIGIRLFWSVRHTPFLERSAYAFSGVFGIRLFLSDRHTPFLECSAELPLEEGRPLFNLSANFNVQSLDLAYISESNPFT